MTQQATPSGRWLPIQGLRFEALAWMLETLGFSKTEIVAGVTGAFSRSKPLTHDDCEMLVVAAK